MRNTGIGAGRRPQTATESSDGTDLLFFSGQHEETLTRNSKILETEVPFCLMVLFEFVQRSGDTGPGKNSV